LAACLRNERGAARHKIQPWPSLGIHYSETGTKAKYKKSLVIDKAGTMHDTRLAIKDRMSEVFLLY
jgi:hypothetical protein